MSQMKAAGMAVSRNGWALSFVRQVSTPMDAGEWDDWLQAMADGHDQISHDDLRDLRCTCTVQAVLSLLQTAPERREQCQDAWRAMSELVEKITNAPWFEDCDQRFHEEVDGVGAMALVGSEMHHSSAELQEKAEQFRKKLQNPSTKASMHFSKLLTQSTAGVQLSAAICEVLAAQEKISGWTEDLSSAYDAYNSLPALLQEHFLNKDYDIVVPSSAKVAEIQTKLGALLTASTGKFQSDNSDVFGKLTAFQSTIAGRLKSALANRVFCKFPALADAICWCMNGPTIGSNAVFDGHISAIVAAKSAVGVRTQMAKWVGTDLAKSLNDYSSDFGKFLVAMENFCRWFRDAEEGGKNAGSLSVFLDEKFLEWTHYFQDSLLKEPLKFNVGDMREKGPEWSEQMKTWLYKWSQKRVTASLSSCKSFVGFVLQEDVEIDQLCREPVTGSVDADEEFSSIRSSIRELANIACTVCLDKSSLTEFDFGESKIDLQSLCAASIYLPAARYTVAVLQVVEKMLKCSMKTALHSRSVDDIKTPGSSRTESASNLLGMSKRWIEAGSTQNSKSTQNPLVFLISLISMDHL